MIKCSGGPASKPCPFDATARYRLEATGSEWHPVCWRHLVPALRPIVTHGHPAPRVILAGA